MTGYGRSTLQMEDLSLFLEIASVNKRHLEIFVSAPKEWQKFEYDAIKYVKSILERGRVRISISAVKNTELEKKHAFNESQIQEDLDWLENFLIKKKQPFNITAELILQLANTQKSEPELPILEKVCEQLEQALNQACEELMAMRDAEGRAIKTDLTERIDRVAELVVEMKKSSEGMVFEHKEKLLERLRKSGLSIDENDDRVVKEIALFAEKSDTSEEITRLESHLQQMKETFELKGSIGRKIEFLLQEISRELNTFCSKSVHIQSTKIALEARTEIEKMREQSLNIE
jgi:uncharacterized protein (TIGR00255 family)